MRIEKAAKAQPKRKGRLAEWIVTWSYSGNTERSIDFVVMARSNEDAELFVVKAVAEGQDSKGADLTWTAKIPWDERNSYPIEEEHEEKSSAKELRALGEGWVEVR